MSVIFLFFLSFFQCLSYGLIETETNNSNSNNNNSNNDNTQNFLKYENFQYRFKILYPEEWKVIQFDNINTSTGPILISSFVSPLLGIDDNFQEYFITKLYYSNYNEKNHFLSLYVKQLYNSYSSLGISNFAIINSTTNKENDISNIQYQITLANGVLIQKIEQLFFKSDRVFVLEFSIPKSDLLSENNLVKIISNSIEFY